MSKRLYNVVNPDDVVARYGADTLRLYEMFLGPLTDAKPWNTNGISGNKVMIRACGLPVSRSIKDALLATIGDKLIKR